jgi:predicted transcriptional regulator
MIPNMIPSNRQAHLLARQQLADTYLEIAREIEQAEEELWIASMEHGEHDPRAQYLEDRIQVLRQERIDLFNESNLTQEEIEQALQREV